VYVQQLLLITLAFPTSPFFVLVLVQQAGNHRHPSARVSSCQPADPFFFLFFLFGLFVLDIIMSYERLCAALNKCNVRHFVATLSFLSSLSLFLTFHHHLHLHHPTSSSPPTLFLFLLSITLVQRRPRQPSGASLVFRFYPPRPRLHNPPSSPLPFPLYVPRLGAATCFMHSTPQAHSLTVLFIA